MKFIRRYYWFLYPLVGALVGAYLTYESGNLETGIIDGGAIGASFAIWYWIRKGRGRQW